MLIQQVKSVLLCKFENDNLKAKAWEIMCTQLAEHVMVT